MNKLATRRRPKPIHEKRLIEVKDEEKPISSDKIFVNLIADIVFENLLNKYRK